MSLYCLVYTSISNQKMTNDDLKALLNTSRRKNADLNITGLLLYLDPFFIQILEGKEDVVNNLFDSFSRDARHSDISLIYKKEIEERNFPNWTMGFNRISKEEIETLECFNDFLQQNQKPKFLKESSKEIEKFLDMFKHETLF